MGSPATAGFGVWGNAIGSVSVRGKIVSKAQKGTSLPRDTNLTPYTPQHAVQIARTVGFLFLSLFKIYQSQTGLSIQSSNDVIKVKYYTSVSSIFFSSR